MKQSLCLVLAILLLVSFVGCTQNNTAIRSPVDFYYCTSSSTYAVSRRVIACETREAEPFEQDMLQLLTAYLQGPESDDLQNPFPDDTSVVSFVMDGQNASITLTSQFSTLSGMDLTIACACLSITVIGYTGCEQVTICAENSVLDQQTSITMHRSDLLIDTLAEDNAP